MRNGQILVYPFSCVHCTSPMFLFLFVQHRHHRDAVGTNWGSLGLLATFTMGESPLKLTSIIACTRGFHSRELKLQKQGRCVMFILLANFRKACLKRFCHCACVMANSLFTRFPAFTALLPCSTLCSYDIHSTDTHSALTGAICEC